MVSATQRDRLSPYSSLTNKETEVQKDCVGSSRSHSYKEAKSELRARPSHSRILAKIPESFQFHCHSRRTREIHMEVTSGEVSQRNYLMPFMPIREAEASLRDPLCFRKLS